MTDQFDPKKDTHYRHAGAVFSKLPGESQAAFAERVEAHRSEVKARRDAIERQNRLREQEQRERQAFHEKERAYHTEQARLQRWGKMNAAERVDRAIDRLAGIGLVADDAGGRIGARARLTAALEKGEGDYTTALDTYYSRAAFHPDGDGGGEVVTMNERPSLDDWRTLK